MLNKKVLVHSFLQDLLILIDKGEVADFETIKEVVNNGTLVPFLKVFSSEYAKKYEMLTFYFKEEEVEYINKAFIDYVYAYNGREDRKLGISKNGLVLLVSYGIELVRELEKGDVM
jgi:hypothetical protein